MRSCQAPPPLLFENLVGGSIPLHPTERGMQTMCFKTLAHKVNDGLKVSCKLVLFKGYVHYKMIISQNALSEAQVKNFFISLKSYGPFSRYSSFCIFNNPMIYQICDMMSISTWDTVHFWICLLNCNSLSQQTWPIEDIKKGNGFQESFEQFGGVGLG